MLRDLREAAARYQQRFGRRIVALSDLVESGIVAEVPKPPFGYGFAINEQGQVVLQDSPPRAPGGNAEMNAAISVSNLRKTYPRSWASPPFEALKGISLSIEAGETFGFIGPNGAGKSTTIKILTGVMSPSEGTASLFGVDVSDPESRRGLGYVPENPSLPDYLTPYEILSMGLKLHRRRPAGARAHCMAWLERFGLADVANKVVRAFPRGWRSVRHWRMQWQWSRAC